MFSEEDYQAFVKVKKAEDRHFRYCRSVKRYIRENRDALEMNGWIEWAYEESRKPFVYGRPLPAWTQEQIAELEKAWVERRPKKAAK